MYQFPNRPGKMCLIVSICTMSPCCTSCYCLHAVILAMQIGAKWLQDWCSRVSGAQAAGAQADDTLALAVAQVLLTGKSSEEAASELFDVFGDASFEPIQQLLQSR